MSVTETVQNDQDIPVFPFPDTFSPRQSGQLADLARQAPATRVRFGPGQLPIWLILRYAPARAMLADPRFSRTRTLEFNPPLTAGQIPDPNSLLWMDPPDHTRLRRLVNAGFAHRRIERMRPWIAATARARIDAMLTAGAPGDLRGLAFHLPIEVICQLLGVPDLDREKVRTWSESLFRFHLDPKAAAAGLGALYGYMGELVRSRRAAGAGPSTGASARTDGGEQQPADAPRGLLDVVIAAYDEEEAAGGASGARLSEAELHSLAMTLLIGGFETTGGVISNVLTTLLSDRSRWESLIALDADGLPNAVEELLRYHPLSMTFPRVATEDVDLGGFVVRAGEVAVVPLAAMSRDPDVFPDPDRIDLTREPVPNLTFGHGPHHCIGAHLARVELTEVLTALIEKTPGLRLTVPAKDLRYELKAPIGRPETIPVTW
ncbi:putative cytochrome P450 [Frankia canadensis]|uniref:Putative cytochrome P450 n=1 Tax=Frankia canadensis TaxID=1836972 RepID=A0A2I2KUK5_9ACTN|nr:cytochrome P450 [Frankia canadensis]SNQ49345.1 putative cytochrome P450 [Frankia canadensis]SOU56635.1 putative cytochrome P450 [Frankia canadensis]